MCALGCVRSVRVHLLVSLEQQGAALAPADVPHDDAVVGGP